MRLIGSFNLTLCDNDIKIIKYISNDECMKILDLFETGTENISFAFPRFLIFVKSFANPICEICRTELSFYLKIRNYGIKVLMSQLRS